MTKYLISFPSSAMVIPDGEWQAVSDDSHAVVQEARDAGVWVFGGGIDEAIPPVMVAGDGDGDRGHVSADEADRRRLRGARTADTRGGHRMGGQDRRCMPLRAGGPCLRGRPDVRTARCACPGPSRRGRAPAR